MNKCGVGNFEVPQKIWGGRKNFESTFSGVTPHPTCVQICDDPLRDSWDCLEIYPPTNH